MNVCTMKKKQYLCNTIETGVFCVCCKTKTEVSVVLLLLLTFIYRYMGKSYTASS